jgi:hypothetical protein
MKQNPFDDVILKTMTLNGTMTAPLPVHQDNDCDVDDQRTNLTSVGVNRHPPTISTIPFFLML